jgi:hypothetical protein
MMPGTAIIQAKRAIRSITLITDTALSCPTHPAQSINARPIPTPRTLLRRLVQQGKKIETALAQQHRKRRRLHREPQATWMPREFMQMVITGKEKSLLPEDHGEAWMDMMSQDMPGCIDTIRIRSPGILTKTEYNNLMESGEFACESGQTWEGYHLAVLRYLAKTKSSRKRAVRSHFNSEGKTAGDKIPRFVMVHQQTGTRIISMTKITAIEFCPARACGAAHNLSTESVSIEQLRSVIHRMQTETLIDPGQTSKRSWTATRLDLCVNIRMTVLEMDFIMCYLGLSKWIFTRGPKVKNDLSGEPKSIKRRVRRIFKRYRRQLNFTSDAIQAPSKRMCIYDKNLEMRVKGFEIDTATGQRVLRLEYRLRSGAAIASLLKHGLAEPGNNLLVRHEKEDIGIALDYRRLHLALLDAILKLCPKQTRYRKTTTSVLNRNIVRAVEMVIQKAWGINSPLLNNAQRG